MTPLDQRIGTLRLLYPAIPGQVTLDDANAGRLERGPLGAGVDHPYDDVMSSRAKRSRHGAADETTSSGHKADHVDTSRPPCPRSPDRPRAGRVAAGPSSHTNGTLRESREQPTDEA
jgi:hypothetical protein